MSKKKNKQTFLRFSNVIHILYIVHCHCLVLSPVRLSRHRGLWPANSSVNGVFQARILEWVAMLSSRGLSQPRDQTCLSCIAGGFFPC